MHFYFLRLGICGKVATTQTDRIAAGSQQGIPKYRQTRVAVLHQTATLAVIAADHKPPPGDPVVSCSPVWCFIIGGIISLILLVIFIGISLNLWGENQRMKDNDIKFRMVLQIDPKTGYKADSLYHSDPDEMQKKTEQMEADQRAAIKADAEAKQKEQELFEAKKKAKKFKKSKLTL